MMKTFRFALFAILLCLSACSSGGDDPIEPTPKPEVTKSEITIDSGIISNGLSFADDGGEQTISFTTNENWTLNVANTTSGATWCTASATSGTKGSASVKFTVTENTDYEDRSVSVTIKSGTAAKTFTISQKSADALLVTTNKYEVGQEGGTIEIEVKANIDYKMEISEKAKDWITESSSRALATYKHKLDIAMNEDVEKREGEITFKSGDKVETVKVYQTGGAIILLSQDEYTVSDAGETISVEIKSNVEFGVQMPDVDWITDEASSRGMSSHTLKYAVAPNEGYDSRSAEIIFYDKNSELKDTLKVVQAQKDAIVISQKEYNVKAEGETIEVKLSANVGLEVIMPEVDWISQVESRALTEAVFCFKVAANEDKFNRAARIVFTNKEAMLSDTLLINQVNDYGHYECIGYTNGLFGTVELYKAGILSHFVDTYIGEKSEDGYNIDLTKLSVVGYINGDDIKVLNALFENNHSGFELDLSDAIIVEGGGSYYTYHSTDVDKDVHNYTKDNVIGSYMFTESKATSIILPKNAIKISSSAFYNNSNVIHVTTSDGVTSIGSGAFTRCSKLMSVDIGNSVTSIGSGAFSNCSRLMSVDIGNSVTSIGSGAFRNCSTLREVVIPDNVTEIGSDAFYDCSALESVYIGNGVTTIGYNAFLVCTNLKSVHLGNSVTTIGYKAFCGCSTLREVVIPDNVTEIGFDAFEGCFALECVHIGNGVTTIGSGAFYDCSNLKIVHFGKGLTSIESKAFVKTGITECYCYATIPPSIYVSKENDLFSRMEETFYGISKATLYVPAENVSAYESSGWAKYFSVVEMD